MEKFLKQQEKKQKKEVKREEKKQEKLFSKAKKDQRSFLRDSFPPIGRKNEFTLHQLKNFNESNELKIPYFCEDNTFQNIFLGLKEEPDQQGIVTTDVLRRKMYDSFLDEPPSGPGRCDCEQCRRIELTDGNMNEMHCHYLDEEDGMTVMSQPPLHIVKGDKIVPIMPIAVLSGIIVVINLAIMMIFIDLLARQAVGSQTYFGIWGPACIVILAGGAMSIYMFAQSTIIFALIVSLIMNFIGSIVQSIIPLVNNTGCKNKSRCTNDYLYGMYSVMLFLGLISFGLHFGLLYVVQFKVKREERVEEVEAAKLDAIEAVREREQAAEEDEMNRYDDRDNNYYRDC